MKGLGVVGRVIFALAFITFGVIHLIMGAKFGGLVPGFLPAAAFWVYLTGVAYILAAISIIIGKQVGLACSLLGIVVFIIAFSVHLPAMINATKNQAMLGELIKFVKAMAIGGAAWYIAGVYGFNRKTTASV